MLFQKYTPPIAAVKAERIVSISENKSDKLAAPQNTLSRQSRDSQLVVNLVYMVPVSHGTIITPGCADCQAAHLMFLLTEGDLCHQATCLAGTDSEEKLGYGHCFGHRLKPVADMRNLLKQVGRASSALERTLAIRRRFESAGLAETITDVQK